MNPACGFKTSQFLIVNSVLFGFRAKAILSHQHGSWPWTSGFVRHPTPLPCVRPLPLGSVNVKFTLAAYKHKSKWVYPQAWSLESPLTVHEYFLKVEPFKLKKKNWNALCGAYDKICGWKQSERKWLRLHVSTAGGEDSVPSQGTKISHTRKHSQKFFLKEKGTGIISHSKKARTMQGR